MVDDKQVRIPHRYDEDDTKMITAMRAGTNSIKSTFLQGEVRKAKCRKTVFKNFFKKSFKKFGETKGVDGVGAMTILLVFGGGTPRCSNKT